MRREPGRAEQRDLLLRQVVGGEHPGADRVVDVVVDVRDAVDDADDLPLERLRLVGPGVLEDPVAHLPGEVEPAAVALERSTTRSECSLWRKPPAAALAQQLVERLLARVAERRVAEVVAEPDRLDEILVQPQRPRDAARDAGRLERVRQPRAEVVALGVDEDLRLVPRAGGTPSSGRCGRGRAGTACAGGTPPRERAAAGLVRADGERRQPALLVLAHARSRRRRQPYRPAPASCQGTPRSAAAHARATCAASRSTRSSRVPRASGCHRSARLEDDRDGSAVGAPRGAGDVAGAIEHRKTITEAISSGSARRPSGRPAPTAASTSSRVLPLRAPAGRRARPRRATPRSRSGPGVTALQRMPSFA